MSIPLTLPVAFLAAWAIACVGAFLIASAPAIFGFAYFVLPFSAFVVPLCFAQLSARLTSRDESTSTVSEFSIVLSAATAVVCIVAYALSVSVISRFLEIPWRAGKFGDGVIDLGRPAAQLYCLLATLTALSALALLRATPSNSRYAHYAIGSLGMLLSASLAYLLFGLSSFVHWRA